MYYADFIYIQEKKKANEYFYKNLSDFLIYIIIILTCYQVKGVCIGEP